MDILFIVAGLVLLVFGGDWLLKAAVALSLKLNISKIVIGMTVVSFATSAPELIVSIKAALDGSPDLSLGNVVGSNIANLALVLGITVMLGGMSVRKSFYTTDWPVMMAASLLFFGFIYFDGELQQYEGVLMVIALIAFLIYLLKFQKKPEEQEEEVGVVLALNKTIMFLVFGGIALWGGSELLIEGAKSMALSFGVSERVIGVTVVSVGTSVPELAASIIAVIKKEKAISLGNLIGSNIFNLLAVLGITSIITPIRVMDQTLLSNDIFWMLGISFIVLPLVFMPRKLHLAWKDGIVLLATYVVFVYLTLS